MGVFGVWCAKCAKYLAFDTFGISTVDALIYYYYYINTVYFIDLFIYFIKLTSLILYKNVIGLKLG